MELSTHDDDALPIDLQGAIVPLHDCLEAVVGGKDPQQHQDEAEDEL